MLLVLSKKQQKSNVEAPDNALGPPRIPEQNLRAHNASIIECDRSPAPTWLACGCNSTDARPLPQHHISLGTTARTVWVRDAHTLPHMLRKRINLEVFVALSRSWNFHLLRAGWLLSGVLSMVRHLCCAQKRSHQHAKSGGQARSESMLTKQFSACAQAARCPVECARLRTKHRAARP